MKIRKQTFRKVAGHLLVFLISATAYAYIPPAQFIIKNMAARRSGMHLLRIVSQVSGYDLGKPTGMKIKSVTVYNPSSHILRSQVFDVAGHELFGIEKKGDEIPLSLTVLFNPSAREVETALRRVDIPIRSDAQTEMPSPTPSPEEEPLSLRRWDGSVAWVLGLSASRKDGSQLWVEKDTFLPVRLRVEDQDFQFTKFRASQNLPYPRSVSLSNRAGMILLEEGITELQVNPPGSVEHVTVANGYTDAGNASPAKELIRKYYAGLR